MFDIKARTLGFAFCQPPKKSLPKSLTQKKSLQNFKPKKSPQIANFKPKKGLRTSPSLIYLSTPPGEPCYTITIINATMLRSKLSFKIVSCRITFSELVFLMLCFSYFSYLVTFSGNDITKFKSEEMAGLNAAEVTFKLL